MVFGSAFLAGTLVFWANHDLEKAVVFGSAFLAGALVFNAKPDKIVVFGVGVPSKGSCVLGKTCAEKSRGARGRRS